PSADAAHLGMSVRHGAGTTPYSDRGSLRPRPSCPDYPLQQELRSPAPTPEMGFSPRSWRLRGVTAFGRASAPGRRQMRASALSLKVDPVAPGGAELGVPDALEDAAAPLDRLRRGDVVHRADGQQPAQRPGGQPAPACRRPDAVTEVAGPPEEVVAPVPHSDRPEHPIA